MGPKRGKGAVKKSQRETGRIQVAKRSRSPTPPPAEDEAMLVPEPEQPQSHLAGEDLHDIIPVEKQPPAKSVRTNLTAMQY